MLPARYFTSRLGIPSFKSTRAYTLSLLGFRGPGLREGLKSTRGVSYKAAAPTPQFINDHHQRHHPYPQGLNKSLTVPRFYSSSPGKLADLKDGKMTVPETQKPIEVLTYGGGSMGALYSFIISRNTIRPVNVTIKCRSNYQQVSSSGYAITSDLLGTHTYRPHRVIRDTSELLSPNPKVEYDYIFVSTKATIPGGKVDIPSELVTPGKTSIVLLQNGVGIEEPYKAAFPGPPVISVVCYVSVLQPGPGEIRHVGSVDMVFCGLYPPPPTTGLNPQEVDANAKLSLLTTLWTSGGCNAILTPNIISERWRKTVWNGCWNVICVLTGLDTHSVIESSKYSEDLVRSVTEEIVRTARMVLEIDGPDGKQKAGVDEELANVWDMEARVGMNLSLAAQTVAITPSMLQDARKGIEMEVEVLCGNIVREAQKHGVHTPILNAFYPILLAMNHRFRKARL